MRVLWLCNVVLPDFSEEFGLKKTVVGGWMTGMLAALEDEPGIEIALAFPIIDEWRMADGVAYGHPYYSFGNENRDRYELRIKRQDRFREIIHAYNPDIIHLWGTEFPWALEMVELCEEEGDIDRVFVHIQGLVSNCTKHYLSGIPEEDTEIAGEDGKTLKDIGRVNSYIVRERFNVNAQPNYALLSSDGDLLVPVRGYDLSVDGFVEFLKSGIEKFNNQAI